MKSQLGLILAAIAVFPAFSQTANQPGTTLSAPGGRYVFGQISALRRDQYMLDTQTGRLWQFVCVEKDATDQTTCLENGLEPVPFLNSKGDYHGSIPPVPPASKP